MRLVEAGESQPDREFLALTPAFSGCLEIPVVWAETDAPLGGRDKDPPKRAPAN